MGIMVSDNKRILDIMETDATKNNIRQSIKYENRKMIEDTRVINQEYDNIIKPDKGVSHGDTQHAKYIRKILQNFTSRLELNGLIDKEKVKELNQDRHSIEELRLPPELVKHIKRHSSEPELKPEEVKKKEKIQREIDDFNDKDGKHYNATTAPKLEKDVVGYEIPTMTRNLDQTLDSPPMDETLTPGVDIVKN